MAKRNQPLKDFEMFGRPKKPKLNISLSKARPLATKNNANTHDQDIWDDDDVILLATQIAESQTFGERSKRTDDILLNTETEITFTELMSNVNTSTQKQVNSTNWKSQVNLQDNLSQIFANDDDDDFAMLAVAESLDAVQKEKPSTSKCVDGTINLESEIDVFKKKPAQLQCKITTNETEMVANVATSHQSVARRQLASERQIKFLMDKIDTLKKENGNLSKELCNIKAKIESKDGEANLLRDELRHTKHQMQTMKIEKMFNRESAKNECEHKLEAMSRQMEAKETELQLKAVECSILKMRQADETKRLELRVAADAKHSNIENCNNRLSQRAIMRINTLNINTVKTTGFSSVYDIKFDLRKDNLRNTINRRNAIFETQLRNLQEIIVQLQSKNVILEHEIFIDRIYSSANIVFKEFENYVQSLNFAKNCHVYPYQNVFLEESICCDKKHDVFALLNLDELYDGERASRLRRYIALLSFVCRLIPNLSQRFLTSGDGDILQTVSNTICKLGFSLDFREHLVLMEAFGMFLQAILYSLGPEDSEKYADLLVGGMLKQIVFARPNAWIFRTLSDCMLRCIELPDVVSLLCINSTGTAFVTDQARSLHRFTHDSCILQVYAGLLENTFPFSNRLTNDQFELLTVICANHIRFVYYCFAKPPPFIRSCLPSYVEDGEDEEYSKGNSTPITANVNQCECYTKLCLSIVTLIFQLLRNWLNDRKLKDHQRISEISKLSVQLLHIIFCDYYLTCLFRDAEEITKHHLRLICKWWQDNAELLQFNSLHLNFLQKLQNSHIVQKCVGDEENFVNVKTDFNDWESITNDLGTNIIEPMELQQLSIQNLDMFCDIRI